MSDHFRAVILNPNIFLSFIKRNNGAGDRAGVQASANAMGELSGSAEVGMIGIYFRRYNDKHFCQESR